MTSSSPERPLASPSASPRLAYAMLALVMMLWAGNSIVGRAVREEIPPFTLALLRWSGAFLVLAPFATRRLVAERRELLRAWRMVLLLGFLGVACFNAFLYSALRHTTATNALLMQAAIPAVVLAADFALFRARPRPLEVGGVLLSMTGVALIVVHGDLSALGRTVLNRGDLMMLGGVFCWATYTSLLRLRPPLAPSSFLAATFVIGIAAMLPLAATEWREVSRIAWTPPVLLAIAYVAVLPSVVAYGLFNTAVARLGAGPAGQAINLMPVMGAVLAAATLGEPLHAFHWTGMGLVLLGIAAPILLAARGERARPRQPHGLSTPEE